MIGGGGSTGKSILTAGIGRARRIVRIGIIVGWATIGIGTISGVRTTVSCWGTSIGRSYYSGRSTGIQIWSFNNSNWFINHIFFSSSQNILGTWNLRINILNDSSQSIQIFSTSIKQS